MRKIGILAVFICLILVFSGCGKKNVTTDGIELGNTKYASVDILGVRYDFYDSGFATISKILNENASLNDTIQYEGKEYTIVSLVSNVKGKGVCGLYMEGIQCPENLVLPNGISCIAPDALSYCNSKVITLPSKLTTISASAFFCCTELEYLEIPDSVTTIMAYETFAGCKSLKSVTFPKNSEINSLRATFSQCESLESIIIPGTCEEISSYAFADCFSLKDVTLCDGIKSIKSYAFSSCNSLETIVIPDSVTTIEQYAFIDCSALKDVVLSDGLLDVPELLFVEPSSKKADMSGLTVHIKSDLVEYAQSLWPTVKVVAK